MELIFYKVPDKELPHCDLLAKEGDGTQTYNWPFLPRKGEIVSLTYDKRKTIMGLVCAVHWESVGGFLNAVKVFLEPIT